MLDQSAAGEKMTVRIGRTTLGFRLQGRNDTDQENGRTIQGYTVLLLMTCGSLTGQ